MALGLSSTVANGLLNALCRGTNYTAPTAVWVQLHIGDPGAAGTSNAATETARKQATFGSAASGGTISNTVAINWNPITGSQDATHYSAWDASTSGNFLFSGTITANAYTAGDNYQIAIGDLDVAFGIAA